MTPSQFIARWRDNPLSERASAQAFFLDLCALLGVDAPNDPDDACFARGVTRTGAGHGWVDVWKRGHFGCENKGLGGDLGSALRQLMTYALALDNTPLLVVSNPDAPRTSVRAARCASSPPAPPAASPISPNRFPAVARTRRRSLGWLLQVAARAGSALSDLALDRDELVAWVGALAAAEQDEVITKLVVDSDQAAVTDLRQRFLRQRGAAEGRPVTTGRTVGELLAAAEAQAKQRRRVETGKRAEEKTRREREAAVAREQHLDGLVGREARLWAETDALVATTQAAGYDQALRHLVDLRDLDARGRGGDFRLRIALLRQAHARKLAFVKRLDKAGL